MKDKLIVLTSSTAYKASVMHNMKDFVVLTLADSGAEVKLYAEDVVAVFGYSDKEWQKYRKSYAWHAQA